MEILTVNLEEPLKKIGSGDEGVVYNYQNKYAIKIFTGYKGFDQKRKLTRKISKIEAMSSLKDPSYAFPKGLVTTNGYTIEGYYYPIVRTGKLKDFYSLEHQQNDEFVKRFLIKGDAALQRFHKMGGAVGDIKGNNILIDRDRNPVYIDTDNYLFQNYNFDLLPSRAGCFYSLYGGRALAFQENDKLLYAIMALKLLTKDMRFDYMSSAFEIDDALKELDVDSSTREQLKCIFSDAENKPYMGKILEKIR